jgi:hypothetical protein
MKNFLKYYFSLFFTLLVLVSSPVLFLSQVGEYENLNTVIERQKQQTGKTIYGTGLHSNFHIYKKLLLSASEPKVVVLGSSRVMQFRQHMFSEDFINLGGAMNSINQGIDIAPDIIEKKVDVVILGIDAWWFNEYVQNPSNKNKNNERRSYPPTLVDVYTVIKWMANDKLSLTEMLRATINGTSDIGVRGQYKDGFGPDGSHYYTRRITGRKEHEDIYFEDTLQRIRDGNRKFQYSSEAHQQHIANFTHLIKQFERSGINVIILFPPFAEAVNNHFNVMKEQYGYIRDIKSKLNGENIKYYDYTDATSIGSNDCEFIDGFHGGEVTYMRILFDIMQNDVTLDGLIESESLINLVDKYAGRAFVPDKEITSNDEVDFLGLGCKK